MEKKLHWLLDFLERPAQSALKAIRREVHWVASGRIKEATRRNHPGTPQCSPEKGLRARLLGATRDEADRCYGLSIPLTEAGLDEAHRNRRARMSRIDERARAAKPKN